MPLSVPVRSARKIGFFAALTMLLGSVVGIGIFFKNHGVLRANDWDGIGVIVAWVIGGLICLAAALVYSEMGSMKTNKVHGLSGWAYKINGKAFGYFHRFNYSFLYYGLLTAALGIFASEGVTNAFVVPLAGKQPEAWAHVLIGLGMVILFVTLNYYSVHASGIFQQVSTALKFVPLIVVGLAGVILFTTNFAPAALGETNLFGHDALTNGRGFNFANMLASLPGVLFAYDAFLGVGSLSNKVVGGQKRVPLIVIVGMLTVIVLYTLIAIAAAAHGSGLVTGLAFQAPPSSGLGMFDQIFPADVARSMGIFVTVFIAISSLGVLNGISAALVATIDQAMDTDTLFKSQAIKRKFKGLTPLVVSLATTVTWMIIFGIPAIVLKSDSIVDGLSNFPTLFSFAMYIPILIMYLKKRKTLGIKLFNTGLIWTCVLVACAGIAVVVGYQVFYAFSVKGWIAYALGSTQESSYWGLFVGDSLYNWQTYLVMVSMIVAFAGFPYLNKWLITKFEKRDVYEFEGTPTAFAEEWQHQSKLATMNAVAVDAHGRTTSPIAVSGFTVPIPANYPKRSTKKIKKK